jgi:sulfatase maturation enzyme AslB (radical SAM superfamily)
LLTSVVDWIDFTYKYIYFMPLERKDKDRIVRYFGPDYLVYPHMSRRLGGLSIGINTFPSKICNFGCLYCAVDRNRIPGNDAPLNVDTAKDQLETVLAGLQGSEFRACFKS